MKLRGLILVVAVIVFSILATLTGCDEKAQNNENQTNEEQVEQTKLKAGLYGYISTGEEGLYDGAIGVTIEDDGTIMLYDGFASLCQIGEYTIEGNKIVGTYHEAIYIDHANGGQETTKEINEKFEFEIIDEETIKDLIGYGESFDNIMMTDALYRYNNTNENIM